MLIRSTVLMLALVTTLAPNIAACTPTEGDPVMPKMPSPDPLVWQGAADRKPVQFIPIRVVAIHKEGGGLFGIGNSPSLAGSMPEPRLVEGHRIGAEAASIRLRAPNGELPKGLAKGARLVLGLVDPQHVICVLRPPETVADAALSSWAESQSCS